MKKRTATLIPLMISTLLLAGCLYDAPLSTERTIPIDPAFPGLWEQVSERGNQSESDRMMILKYSDTEYVIHHPVNDGGMFFQTYPVEINGRTYVQIKIIGTPSGSLDRGVKEIYHLASFTVTNEIMEVRLLNPKVVSPDLKTTEELRKAFLKNIKHPNLFEGPLRFKRYKQEKNNES